MKTKLLSFLLTISMLLSLLPAFALAAEMPADGVQPRHTTSTPTPEAIARSLELYNNFLAADPQLFRLTEQGIIGLDYTYDAQPNAELNYVRQKTMDIVAGCTTADEQIFAVASYLARNICYDYDALNENRTSNRKAYDVLTKEFAVCTGYANTFNVMMQMLGHPCGLVNAPDHAWNVVHNGERWMLIDVTWMSNSARNNNVNTKSDTIDMSWYDFTIEQALADYNHTINALPLSIADGVMFRFPRYTTLTTYEIPCNVTSIGDYMFYGNPATLYVPKSVTSLGRSSFGMSDVTRIYYEGTAEEFNRISKGSRNDKFFNASITYNAYTPTPLITSHPADTYTAVSIPTTLSVSVASTTPVTYQWYVNTVRSNTGCAPVEGATGATFTPPTSTPGTLYYCVVVSNGSSYAISEPAEVTVYPTMPEDRLLLVNGIYALLFPDLNEVWIEGNGTLNYEQLVSPNSEGYATIRIGAGITGLPDNLNDTPLFMHATNYAVDPGNPVYMNDAYGVLINKAENKLQAYPQKATADSYSISEGIVSVAEGAFTDCTNLQSLHIPTSLRSLPDLNFSITSVTIANGNTVFYVDDSGVLINSAEHHIVRALDSNDLISYTVDSSIRSIGNYAFFDCRNLERIMLPEGLRSIGLRSFQFCDALTSVTLPDSLTQISSYAFIFCDSLSDVTIGKGLSRIASQAFAHCENLRSVYFRGNAPHLEYGVFPEGTVLYYPSTASGWTTPTYGNYAAYPYTPLNGLVMDEYGIWWYYEDNKVQTDYTGLIYFNDAFFYVENGMLNAGYTGLVEYYGNLYYVECGVLKWDYTGLVYWGDLFYYVENGTVNWSYTGLVYLAGEFYYVENGILAQGYTGLIFFADVFYYVECGRINFSYTGLVYCGDTFYYVENGVLNWNYTGLLYFYDQFYYIENGVLNFGYTGLTYWGGTFFYIQNGILDVSYVGLVEFYGAYYYVSCGIIDFSYTGQFLFNGIYFNVVGGIVQP